MDLIGRLLIAVGFVKMVNSPAPAIAWFMGIFLSLTGFAFINADKKEILKAPENQEAIIESDSLSQDIDLLLVKDDNR